MAKLFYFREVVRFALEKEKASITLYKEFVDKTSIQEVRDLFYHLVQEGEKHKIFYTILLETVPKEQSTVVEEDEEYHAYMKELISANQSPLAFSIEEITDIKMALDCAVAIEEDAILFYTNLKNYLPSHSSDKINIIIAALKSKLSAYRASAARHNKLPS